MNSHLHAELMNSRLAEIERSAERFRSEGITHGRRRRFSRAVGFGRPQPRFLRLRTLRSA
jgi:hypothetical protein